MLVQKLEKDLRQSHVSFESPYLSDCSEELSGGVEDRTMVFPIKIRLHKKEKLTLHFVSKEDRQSTMDRILEAMGYSNQLDQYQLAKYLGKITMMAVQKFTGRFVVIKVIAKA